MEITLSIVGTAGRKDDEKRLSSQSFSAMYSVAESLINQLIKSNYPVTHLVSGGSAWADHVAVKLFLDNKANNLRLFIPCEFNNGRFTDKNSGIRQFNPPGDTLNYYHSKFQRKTNINSLSEIQVAKLRGAELITCTGGFHGRNSMVAQSDLILAMTFGNGEYVKEGGTADTVKKYLDRIDNDDSFNKAFHYNLSDGKIYRITNVL